MPNTLMEKLTSNRYKILKILYENQVKKADGTTFAPITQVEIADQLNISKITVNSIFKELQADGLVGKIGSVRGRYELSEKALMIIEQMNIINEKLEEDR